MGTVMPLVGHSLAIFIVSIVMMFVSVTAVVLRSFVRVYVVHAFGWDDAFMAAASVR